MQALLVVNDVPRGPLGVRDADELPGRFAGECIYARIEERAERLLYFDVKGALYREPPQSENST